MLRYRLLQYYNLLQYYKAIQWYATGYRDKTNTRQIIQHKKEWIDRTDVVHEHTSMVRILTYILGYTIIVLYDKYYKNNWAER